jgi:hypothetical protein
MSVLDLNVIHKPQLLHLNHQTQLWLFFTHNKFITSAPNVICQAALSIIPSGIDGVDIENLYCGAAEPTSLPRDCMALHWDN